MFRQDYITATERLAGLMQGKNDKSLFLFMKLSKTTPPPNKFDLKLEKKGGHSIC